MTRDIDRWLHSEPSAGSGRRRDGILGICYSNIHLADVMGCLERPLEALSPLPPSPRRFSETRLSQAVKKLSPQIREL